MPWRKSRWQPYISLSAISAMMLLMALTQCKSKTSETPPPADSTGYQYNDRIREYKAKLSALDFEPGSTLEGQKIFSNSFDKSDTTINDEAFKIYLEFEATLIDTLNERLFKRSDLEEIEAIVWGDSTATERTIAGYADSIKHSGLKFRSTEGMVFIGRGTETIRKTFFNHLSPSTKRFFNQFEIETNQPDSDDGGLIISEKELAIRLGTWDKFLQDYPTHLFSSFAQTQAKYDLYFLMTGMDNTPAYDDGGKLSPDFLNAYKYFVEKYKSGPAGKVIIAYLQLLVSKNFVRDDEVDKFIEQYTIY